MKVSRKRVTSYSLYIEQTVETIFKSGTEYFQVATVGEWAGLPITGNMRRTVTDLQRRGLIYPTRYNLLDQRRGVVYAFTPRAADEWGLTE